ncbi:MAG: hypothetical protein LQ340_001138, partial [Diploschistes diacapsis]
TLTLELAPPTSLSGPVSAAAQRSPSHPYSHNTGRQNPHLQNPARASAPSFRSPLSQARNRSSTQDPDTEAPRSAAGHDVPFFGKEGAVRARQMGKEEKERAVDERGERDVEGSTEWREKGKGKGKAAEEPSEGDSGKGENREEESETVYDVVAGLALWRAERKAAFLRLSGESEGKDGGEEEKEREADFVEGYWPGEVKIIRPCLNNEKGMADLYSGYFGSGVLR